MATKMEEGFKKEQHARQQIQTRTKKMQEMNWQSFKHLKMMYCMARPPPLTSRWNEIFRSKKDGTKGWVTDCSNNSIQRITDDEVATLVSDLERMVPQQAQKVD